MFPGRAWIVTAGVPGRGPRRAEALDAILAEYERLVPPAATVSSTWLHGVLRDDRVRARILGEMLTAVLGQNLMLWRTSPIGTELEEVVVDWLADRARPAGRGSTGC